MNKKPFLKHEYPLSFFIPILFIGIAFALAGVYPFGENNMVTSDLSQQFMPVIVFISDKLRQGVLPVFTYTTSFGFDISAVAAAYISDPLNLLLWLFDPRYIQETLLLSYCIRAGCLGLTSCLYFKKSRLIQLEAPLNTAFAVLYALCAYTLIYSAAFLLLNTMILFPLCLLAIEKLDRDIRPFAVLYTLCVLSSFYYAYMLGILCFMYLVYLDTVCGTKGRGFLRHTGLLLLAAAMAVLLSAVFFLPAVHNTLSGYSTPFGTSFFTPLIYFAPGIMCRGLLFMLDSSITLSLLGILYMGILPLFLTVISLFSPCTPGRERIISAVIAVFFLLSVTLRPIYLFMHIGHAPNAFDVRYGYGITMFFLIFSARLVMRIRETGKKAYIAPFFIIFLGLDLAVAARADTLSFINAGAVLLLVIVYTVGISRLKKGRHIYTFLAVFMLAEAFCTAVRDINVISRRSHYTRRDVYTAYRDSAEKLLGSIDDDGFYRAAEITDHSILSAMTAGYNSISAFSSACDQHATTLARDLGCYSSAAHTLKYIYGSIVTDSIFGIKYLLSFDKDAKHDDINGRSVYPAVSGRLTGETYEKTAEDENTEIYENKTAFPLLFSADPAVINCRSEMVDADLHIGAVFINQKLLLDRITARDNALYETVDIGRARFYACKPEGDENAVFTLRLTKLPPNAALAQSEEQVGMVGYECTVKQDGEYMLNMYFERSYDDISGKNYEIWVNNIPADYDFTRGSFVSDIGSLKAGDKISIKILCARDGVNMGKPLVLRLDTDCFKAAADTVIQNGLKDIKEKNGVVTAYSDFPDDRFIFSTITYSDGLKLYIDGQEAETVRSADAFLGFHLPAGRHDITIRCTPLYLIRGLYISLISLILITVGTIIQKERKNEKETDE